MESQPQNPEFRNNPELSPMYIQPMRYSVCHFNSLLHNRAFWCLWRNTLYLKILWNMERLLLWSKGSIFHIFRSIQKFSCFFFQCYLKIEKWCHDLKNSLWSKGLLIRENMVQYLELCVLLREICLYCRIVIHYTCTWCKICNHFL